MDQSRFRSPVAITAILALLFFVIKTWFKFEIPGWDQFVTLLVAAGIAVGILNDPTNGAAF